MFKFNSAHHYQKGSKRAAALRKMAGALLGPLLEKAAAAAAAATENVGEGVVPSSSSSNQAARGGGEGGDDDGEGDEYEDAVVKARRSVTSLLRADVHFAPPLKRSINTMIGRKAHIDFLETDAYIKFLLWKQRDKFV